MTAMETLAAWSWDDGHGSVSTSLWVLSPNMKAHFAFMRPQSLTFISSCTGRNLVMRVEIRKNDRPDQPLKIATVPSILGGETWAYLWIASCKSR